MYAKFSWRPSTWRASSKDVRHINIMWTPLGCHKNYIHIGRGSAIKMNKREKFSFIIITFSLKLTSLIMFYAYIKNIITSTNVLGIQAIALIVKWRQLKIIIAMTKEKMNRKRNGEIKGAKMKILSSSSGFYGFGLSRYCFILFIFSLFCHWYFLSSWISFNFILRIFKQTKKKWTF